MKLTNYLRDGFIRSVMNDVPKTDYTESIRAALVAAAVAQLPPKIADVWKDLSLRSFVTTRSVHSGGVSAIVPLECNNDWNTTQRLAKKIEEDKTVKKLAAEKIIQDSKMMALERKLKAVVYGVTTYKALREALPEFAKYLPAEQPPTSRSLPVVANVIPDFVEAGWPASRQR